ncbi:MAG: ArnT family glycosyltransferase, partial [Flavobacteriaceae bacterium]
IKFRRTGHLELLTLGGIILIFVLISFAQFKLPHYLNITIPLFAVLSASYLYGLYKAGDSKIWKFLLGSQIFIAILVILLSLLLSLWAFQIKPVAGYVLLSLGILVLIFYCFKKEDVFSRIVTISTCSAIVINSVMNLHFYPSLLEYQAGSTMAKIVRAEEIPATSIYKLTGGHTWSLDFYNREPVKKIEIQDLPQHQDIWLYLTDKELAAVRERGYDWDQQFTVDQFRITRLQARFLNPDTRSQVLNKMHLIHLY